MTNPSLKDATKFTADAKCANCRPVSFVVFPDRKTTPIEAAPSYAAQGMNVFPVPPNTKKSYKSDKFSGTKWGMTNDVEVVIDDFDHWPEAGVGIPTGKVNGIFVVEADTKEGHAKKGHDGIPALKALEAENDKLPQTRMAMSPSGSLHYYFRHPGGSAYVKNSQSELAPGVDVRGDGGMVIAPPSVRDDGTYRWLNDAPLADAPQWLLGMVVVSEPNHSVPDYLEELMNTDAGKGISTDPADMPPKASVARIKRALTVIGSCTHAEWVAILSGVYKELGDVAGFEVIDEWARTGGSQYKGRTQVMGQWRPVVANDGYAYTIGSLFHFANEANPDWWKTVEPDQSQQTKTATKLILNSAEFVADFIPPDYLIDGLLQKSFLYSTTAPTGCGKTAVVMRLATQVAYGLALAGREIVQGKVLFFAGENPDDVRMRWIKLAEEMQIDQNDTERIFWRPGSLSLSDKTLQQRIKAETEACGPFALIVVDTSAAFFEGDDENNNAQMARHARMFRSLISISGAPAIVVTTHPTKNANLDWLAPRGGGAFVNEMDGNLVCIKQPDSMLVELHWQVKFRGPDFAPIPFKLNVGTTEKLKDSKGRKLWTVTAAPITEQEQTAAENQARSRQDALLAVMRRRGDLSLSQLAQAVDWFYATGEPNGTLVNRTLQSLKEAGLAKKERGRWVLTKAGRRGVNSGDNEPF